MIGGIHISEHAFNSAEISSMNGHVVYGSSERKFDVIGPFVHATEKVM